MKVRTSLLLIFSISLQILLGSCQQIPMQKSSVTSSVIPQPLQTLEVSPNCTPAMVAATTPTPTLLPSATSSPTSTPQPPFDFVVTGDIGGNAGPGEFDTPQYFRGACETIKSINPGAFMITVGDTHPVSASRWTIDQVFGTEYLWFPVIGNHELLDSADMQWLRNFQPDANGPLPPNLARQGPDACPQTTYSLDYSNAHFIFLNVYCREDGDTITDGAITDELFDWLAEDLQANQKPLVFVIGHEPAFPQPDAAAGIVRHLGDSLDKYPLSRDRFWALLAQHNVRAYFNGHTHSYSVVKINGVWQVDAGHTYGAWTQATASTFMIFHVNENSVSYETFRTGSDGIYTLKDVGFLD